MSRTELKTNKQRGAEAKRLLGYVSRAEETERLFKTVLSGKIKSPLGV